MVNLNSEGEVMEIITREEALKAMTRIAMVTSSKYIKEVQKDWGIVNDFINSYEALQAENELLETENEALRRAVIAKKKKLSEYEASQIDSIEQINISDGFKTIGFTDFSVDKEYENTIVINVNIDDDYYLEANQKDK